MSLSTPSGGSASEGRTISRGDVAHLAKLARLAVTEEELDLFISRNSWARRIDGLLPLRFPQKRYSFVAR